MAAPSGPPPRRHARRPPRPPEAVRRSGAGWTARCPLHDDLRASLSVGRSDDGRWLLKCHAGCAFDAIVASLGVDARELFPAKHYAQQRERRIAAVYDYDGVFEVVRYEPKNFRQRRRDVPRGYVWDLDGVTPRLYRPNNLACRESGTATEGEKGVDRLWGSTGPPFAARPPHANGGRRLPST